MDDFDDTTSFEPGWRRTGEPRTSRAPYRRSRTHHVVEHDGPPTMPLAPFDEVDPWVEQDRRRELVGVDPRLVRVGAIALAAVLMIPVALALREDGAGELQAAPSTVSSTVPEAVATTVATIPITAAAVAPAPVAVVTPGPSDEDAEVVAIVEQPACSGTYTVVFNDFWNRFPESSGASVDEWLAVNEATLDTPLYVGDELCIPAGATAPTPAPTTTPAPETTSPPRTSPATTTPPTPAPVVTDPVTTPAPVVTAPPATNPPAPAPSPTSAAGVEALIREIWPDDLEDRAVTIARRESGLRPWVNNWCCYGVFAIYFDVGRSWLADLGVTSAQQLFDARTNIRAAYHLYTLAGWTPWRQTDPGS